MPVLITAAALTVLFGGSGDGRTGFLDPNSLRKRLGKELSDGADRDAVLGLADELMEVAKRYEETVASTLAQYAAHVAGGAFTAESILEIYAPVDHARAESMRAIVRIRGAILARLTPDEWQSVFG